MNETIINLGCYTDYDIYDVYHKYHDWDQTWSYVTVIAVSNSPKGDIELKKLVDFYESEGDHVMIIRRRL